MQYQQRVFFLLLKSFCAPSPLGMHYPVSTLHSMEVHVVLHKPPSGDDAVEALADPTAAEAAYGNVPCVTTCKTSNNGGDSPKETTIALY